MGFLAQRLRAELVADELVADRQRLDLIVAEEERLTAIGAAFRKRSDRPRLHSRLLKEPPPDNSLSRSAVHGLSVYNSDAADLRQELRDGYHENAGGRDVGWRDGGIGAGRRRDRG